MLLLYSGVQNRRFNLLSGLHLLLVMAHMLASLATFSSSSKILPGLGNGHPL